MKTLWAGVLSLMLVGAVVSAQEAAAPHDANAAKQTASHKAMSAAGTVKSVADDSLVVTGKDGKDWTFVVDSATKVVAKGAGHMAADKKEAHEAMKITDVVKEGAKVSVQYHDMGGTMHAATVRVM